MINSDFDDFDANSPLAKWEQAVLKWGVDFDDCTEDDILKLINHLEQLNDEENLKTARQILLYKQDPTILFVTKDHWDAIDMIEKLIQLPIRRPNMWFAEDNAK